MNTIILFSIILTIIVYIGAKTLADRVQTPLLTPVLTSTIVIIFLLQSLDITYEQYSTGKELMTFLLGPATVALAVPMYHNRKVIMERIAPALFGLVIGTVSTILSAVWISKLFGLTETIKAAAAVKAVTTPVAVEAVKLIDGEPALAAAFVVVAGIFGAVFAPILLSFFKITDPFSRGLGIGTVSHAVGTSQAIKEGQIQGAVSSMAMGLAAIITSIILPWLYPFIQ